MCSKTYIRVGSLLVLFVGLFFSINYAATQPSRLIPVAQEIEETEPAPDEIDGHPTWDEEVISILGEPGEAREDPLQGTNSGHVGWDKETNEPLADPTIQDNVTLSAEARAELGKEDAAAASAAVDTSQLRFRSGVSQPASRGIDSTFREQAQARGESGTPAYGLIQFPLPFDTAARYELEAAGINFYNYVTGGGLYARIPAGTFPLLEQMLAAGRILSVGPIPLQARVQPDLLDAAGRAPETTVAVTVQLFDVPDEAQLEQLGSFLMIQDTSLHPALPLLSATVPLGQVEALASLPYVRWIEQQVLNTPGNMESTMGLGTDILRDADAFSDGTNVNVGVMDTGIANPYHSDLPSSRVVDQYEYYPGNDAIANDADSHGTHVAGTIGGDNTGWMQGHAPDVEFLIYKLCCNASNTGFTDTSFQNAINRGTNNDMHISNNSWGGGNGQYNTNAEISDRAVRGEYNSQPVNMVIISHNDNNLSRSPGTAKNAVTVGAVKDGNWPDAIVSCGWDNNWPPAERICFSNYGPIDADGDGYTRVKPDVMAPGVRIRSTIPGNTYGYKNGTSMAAPAVSGALASVLDHFDGSNPWLFNWPETIKAMALATAIDVGGNTNLYGRGMLSPYDMSYHYAGATAPHSFWGNTIGSTGEVDQFTFSVPAGYHEVIVALTWPDAVGSSDDVVNDLDLRVYRSSDCSTGYVGGSASIDDTVEYVRVAAGQPGGTWCARVNGFSIASSQTYGLANQIVLNPPSLSVTAYPNAYTIQPNSYFYYYTTVYNSGSTADGAYVRMYAPNGITVQGARIYTDDGREHYYDDSELYHPSGTNYWRVAVGNSHPAAPRLIRWFMRVDNNAAPGSYGLNATAYYRRAGSTVAATNTDYDNITVPAAIAPNLTVNLGAFSSLDLSWTTHSNNCSYEVHTSSNPYFTPYSGTRIAGPFSLSSYNVAGVTGNPAVHHFYAIRAFNCGTDFEDSDHGGEFEFALSPGS